MSSGWKIISKWIKKATPPARPALGGDGELPERIGRYLVTGKLGEGGMGVVYAALDEKLGRPVAVKTMSSLSGDEETRRRFLREARAAASVNHPNVCQLYEISEDRGAPFLVMELMEGETLADRLRRGPLTVADVVPMGLGMLAALGALHSRGIIHRDLKPSNVFLTGHGVKLLDFGLAKPVEPELARSLTAAPDLTRAGMVLGTPHYMAPEQVRGETLDARSDLFATGAILFEMLAGRPAFGGRDMIGVLHATLHEHPPALTGSPAVVAVDRVLRRALAKRPDDRHGSAEAMAEELRSVNGAASDDTPARAFALTRVVVLPFRVLRPDPETDFLAFSLPDAITSSLSRTRSLVVRSSAVAARYAGEAPDLNRIAQDAGVDRVVMGTLMRAGDQLQVNAQLVEAPSGTLVSSETIVSSLGDLFRLQDDLTQRVVRALAVPLSPDAGTPTPDSPHNPQAYALYLQANELGRRYEQLQEARDLYLRAIELDPGFAPAWAMLGRAHRVVGKFLDDTGDASLRAEVALRRALEINPRLALAHKFVAAIEAETGKSKDAVVRLLTEANRHANDPELFAGLVHACRYSGLYEQSIAAHFEARRLDPGVPTSYEQSVLMTGDLERMLAIENPVGVTGRDDVIQVLGYGFAGRFDEAKAALNGVRGQPGLPVFVPWTAFLAAWLERDPVEMKVHRAKLAGVRIMEDPEAIFLSGWLFCDVGDYEHGLTHIRRAIEGGYTVAPTLEHGRAFAGIRHDPEFQALLAHCKAGRDLALAAYRDAGGERLLGC